MEKKLLLFDIDGTLITSGGAGDHSLRLALKERFGIDEDFHDIEIAGRTDSGIARQIFAKHSLAETPAESARFSSPTSAHLTHSPTANGGSAASGDPRSARPH